MSIEIRETTIVPGVGGDAIQLLISDAERDAEGATFRLVLHAKLPAYETPLVAQLQRVAMKIAQGALSSLLQDLATEITQTTHSLEPRRKPQAENGDTDPMGDDD